MPGHNILQNEEHSLIARTSAQEVRAEIGEALMGHDNELSDSDFAKSWIRNQRRIALVQIMEKTLSLEMLEQKKKRFEEIPVPKSDFKFRQDLMARLDAEIMRAQDDLEMSENRLQAIIGAIKGNKAETIISAFYRGVDQNDAVFSTPSTNRLKRVLDAVVGK